MNTQLQALVLTASLCAGAAPGRAAEETANPVRWWVSTPNLKRQLAEQPPLLWQAVARPLGELIAVTPADTGQTMLGLGSSLEPATCSNLWRMTPADRERTLERIVSPQSGIGMNLMRRCIGTPDFTGDAWSSFLRGAEGEGTATPRRKERAERDEKP